MGGDNGASEGEETDGDVGRLSHEKGAPGEDGLFSGRSLRVMVRYGALLVMRGG